MNATSQDQQATATGPQEAHFSWSRWAVLLWLLASLYVLSIGPAAKLYRVGLLPRAAEQFYAPITFLYKNLPPVQRLIDWYLRDVWKAR